MTTIRIMTYQVQRCRGGDGRIDLARVARVIGDGAADIVALQNIDATPSFGTENQLDYLAQRFGMKAHCANPGAGTSAFLSNNSLKGVQEYDLGGGGRCLRADAEVGGKRLHLFNLHLTDGERNAQLVRLLGPDLLGNQRLVSPILVLGDFADFWWGPGNVKLTMTLRRAQHPLWPGTYPARFPLIWRDRVYLRGDLNIIDSTILHSAIARQASSHLPLVVTAQIIDPRNYLRLEKLKRNRMEIAPG